MRLRVTGVLLIVGVGLTVAIGACAGAEPTATPTPTPSPEQVRTGLRQIAPSFSDLPTGYQLVEEGVFVSNEEAARHSVVTDEILRAYDEFGRLMGYEVSYLRGSRVLVATAELYRSGDGARRAFSWLPTGFQSVSEYLEAEMLGQFSTFLDITDTLGTTASFTQLSMKPIGDDSLGGRLTLLVAGTPLTIWLACMLQGAADGCVAVIDDVAVGSPEELALLKEIELVLQSMADRAAALPASL